MTDPAPQSPASTSPASTSPASQPSSSARVDRAGLQVAPELASFLEEEALEGTGVAPDAFWTGFAALIADFGPRNAALLDRRAELQEKIDAWHREHQGKAHDRKAYKSFLEDIGYLLPEGEDFTIETEGVDPEIASVPGPQLVVPITNARFALNAANARWGSLYDCFYGTDTMGGPARRAAMTGAGARASSPARGSFSTRPSRSRGRATRMRGAITCRAARCSSMTCR